VPVKSQHAAKRWNRTGQKPAQDFLGPEFSTISLMISLKAGHPAEKPSGRFAAVQRQVSNPSTHKGEKCKTQN